MRVLLIHHSGDAIVMKIDVRSLKRPVELMNLSYVGNGIGLVSARQVQQIIHTP
jgi:hypothetical protein